MEDLLDSGIFSRPRTPFPSVPASLLSERRPEFFQQVRDLGKGSHKCGFLRGWIHIEEGMSRELCKDCLMVSWTSADALARAIIGDGELIARLWGFVDSRGEKLKAKILEILEEYDG